jgi:hypothetical protein
VYDLLGDGFTLLRFDREAEIAPLVDAAARRAVPLKVVDLNEPDAAALYARNLVLSRPDGHVAWRGDRSPGDPLGLVDRIRGASPEG